MKFPRILITFFLLSFFTAIHAVENPGIAFVHGTSDHREDAYGGYWKTDFIETIAQGLPNPENYFVVHCDYSKYMWAQEAGDCTASQLLNFIDEKKLSSLIVFTHSNGGNVMRWILSNPTYSNDYMALKDKVKRVIALTPSSMGTPIADLILSSDVLGTNLSWLVGYQSDAVKQQRTSDMHVYNEELLLGTRDRPSLPKPFYVVVGTDVIASPFSDFSYCNGFPINSFLKITQLYLDSCSDGFLNCSSQKSAGTVWFYDKNKLPNKLTLSHNQSRHACFGLEKILIHAITAEGDLQ